MLQLLAQNWRSSTQKVFSVSTPKGKPLRAVMPPNLNGKADAGRQWGMDQDCWIMESFNTEDPPCKQLLRDPCLFIITASHGTASCIVCYTGDPDHYSEDTPTIVKISKKFDAKFSIKVIHPDYPHSRSVHKPSGWRTYEP